MNQLISRTRRAVGLAPGEERGAAGASGEPARVRAVLGFEGGSAEVRERAGLASGDGACLWKSSGRGGSARIPPSGSGRHCRGPSCVAFLRVPSSRLHPRCFLPIHSEGFLNANTGRPAGKTVNRAECPRCVCPRMQIAVKSEGGPGRVSGLKPHLRKMKRTLVLVSGSLTKSLSVSGDPSRENKHLEDRKEHRSDLEEMVLALTLVQATGLFADKQL